MNSTTVEAESSTISEAPQLRRSVNDRMLGGVAAGIAHYLRADVTLVRVIVAVLALCTGVGAVLYLAAWLLIPEDGKVKSIAQAWIADRQSQSL